MASVLIAMFIFIGCDIIDDLFNDNGGSGGRSVTPTYAYICTNGTAESGTTTSRNQENCKECNTGYHIEISFIFGDNVCVKDYDYICTHGTPQTGTAITRIEKCKECNTGYELKDDDTCGKPTESFGIENDRSDVVIQRIYFDESERTHFLLFGSENNVLISDLLEPGETVFYDRECNTSYQVLLRSTENGYAYYGPYYLTCGTPRKIKVSEATSPRW